MSYGFKLYEINKFLSDAIEEVFASANTETGEILDSDAAFLDEVQMIKDEKCLSVAKYYKSVSAESDAVSAEIETLKQRREVLLNKGRFLRRYLTANMQPGEKLSDAQCVIGWRKSEGVLITDVTKLPDDVFKIERTPMLTEIKERLRLGLLTEGAKIETRQNLTIR